MSNMEEVISRFPHLAEKLFQELDCKSLVLFRGVKRTWNDSVENLKSYHLKVIKLLTNCSSKSLKNIRQTYNVEAINELASDALQDSSWFLKTTKMTYWMWCIKMIFEPDCEDGILCIYTPFHEAAKNNHLTVYKLMMESLQAKGFDIINPFEGSTKHNLVTPLHIAAKKGHLAICELLLGSYSCGWKFLDMDPGPHYTDKEDLDEELTYGHFKTTLHMAASNGHVSVCKSLMQHMTNLFQEDDSGRTPLDLAIINNNPSVCELIIENLTAPKLKRIIINEDGKFGKTPFNLAAAIGRFSICQFMIDRYQLYDRSYHKLFAYACSYFEEEPNLTVCEMVIKKLKNVNFLDKEGQTQLHEAARHGVLDICKLIVRYVVDWNPKNKNGETPLELAVKNGETETVEFFRSLQAKKSRHD